MLLYSKKMMDSVFWFAFRENGFTPACRLFHSPGTCISR